jgi:hypothetical protein
MIRKSELLSQVRIASPCPADWNEMKGDDKVRYCSECRLNVYNLSDMTSAEAEELLRSREGRLCVRYYQRKDGGVMTRDCPVGLRAVRRRIALAWSAGIAALWSLAGCTVRPDQITGQLPTIDRQGEPKLKPLQGEPLTGVVARPIMGDVVVPPSRPPQKSTSK